jgi:hypothetical protein
MGPVYHAGGAANRREQLEAAAPQSSGFGVREAARVLGSGRNGCSLT